MFKFLIDNEWFSKEVATIISSFENIFCINITVYKFFGNTYINIIFLLNSDILSIINNNSWLYIRIYF